MPHSAAKSDSRPALQAYLLGVVDFDLVAALQQHLVREAWSGASGQIAMVVCEHPPIITIGRDGSREDVLLRSVQLAGRPVEIRPVERGGGAMLHLPGQLAVYPVVPLDVPAWTVGDYLRRLQSGLQEALVGMGVESRPSASGPGLWGTSGQLVAMGIAVRHSIAYYGAQIHVQPSLPLAAYVVSDPYGGTAAGSLDTESHCAVRMSRLRSRVVRAVAGALDCDRYHTHTDHPFLSQRHGIRHVAARAS